MSTLYELTAEYMQLLEMAEDPGRTKSETIRVLTEIYEKGVTV